MTKVFLIIKIMIICVLLILVYFFTEKMREYFFRYNHSRTKFIAHLSLLDDYETLRFLGESNIENIYITTTYHKRSLYKHLQKRIEQTKDDWFIWFLGEYKFYKKGANLQRTAIIFIFVAMLILLSILQ